MRDKKEVDLMAGDLYNKKKQQRGCRLWAISKADVLGLPAIGSFARFKGGALDEGECIRVFWQHGLW